MDTESRIEEERRRSIMEVKRNAEEGAVGRFANAQAFQQPKGQSTPTICTTKPFII